ncbi:leucine-rich repeat extensin-like protein 5 [Salvia divinorum]|uniref:Leucine-rich repeat extensin-like protein 5 n=1 Tax=Salvia divinorum TaxID=28513 RepID=A0ABD1I669_SALDI
MDPPPDSSANSSPRSRHDAPTSAWDDTPKLRLMCSYGGHIIPRPHDKSLCYVGGDTHIVVLDRHCSLSDLRFRLSHTLLNGRPFSLKYQLPSEDLDSLISLASDEDLDNMIEEYDRTAASALKPPSRIRLFLFPSKPETVASMGSLIDDAKSETWFVDALNGSGLLLPRGLSESAAIDTLLEVDHRAAGGGISNSDSGAGKPSPAEKGDVTQEQAVESPPVVETSSSSSGSSTSSPSMANLPPIKVRAEEYKMVGLDEQFSSHMSIAVPNSASPPLPLVNAPTGTVRSGGGGDDERSEKSDHAPSKVRKPPLPLQPVQRKLVDVHNLPSPDSSKHAAAYSLPSPESVASDCSITSVGSLSKNAMYSDTSHQQMRTSNNNSAIDPKMVQDPTQLGDWSQQQYIPNTHYIHHHTPMQQPPPSYYPVYLHHQSQHAADPQQYPMYLMSPTPSQPSYDASARSVYTPQPEMPLNMHHQIVQVPAHQFQQHYVSVPQMQPAPIANAAAGATGGNYGYDHYSSHHMQDQAYYSQQMAAGAPPPPQYQTMTPAAAVMLSQASAQISPEGNQQHS